MDFIKLTSLYDNEIYINPVFIMFMTINAHKGASISLFGHNTDVNVKETPEEIIKLVNEL